MSDCVRPSIIVDAALFTVQCVFLIANFIYLSVARATQIAFCWLFGTSLLFFWPTLHPITNSNFNWAGVVLCIVMLVASLHWHLNAKRYFKGPLRLQPTFALLQSGEAKL